MTTTTKFLGTTDEVTTCDCCGRSDLKSTVALETVDGDVVHYGVVCAARDLTVTEKEVRSGARRADREREEREEAAKRILRDAEDARWQNHLNHRAPHLMFKRFEQIQFLGGIVAAREGYTR